MSHLINLLVAIAMSVVVSGCAASRSPLEFEPGVLLDTLSASISLSITTVDRSLSGSGFLLYRRPDQLHLLLLSPFGNTLMEVFAQGDRITLIYTSRSTAYMGRFDELPDKGGLQGWSLMRWVMDADPGEGKQLSGTVERISRLGFPEKVTYENGLVTSKESPAGDHVYYSKYSAVKGVPLAAELDLRNGRDDRIRITLDDPEVNTPLDDAVFAPHLDGLTVMPLYAIQGL